MPWSVLENEEAFSLLLHGEVLLKLLFYLQEVFALVRFLKDQVAPRVINASLALLRAINVGQVAAVRLGDDGAGALADAHLASVFQETVADLGRSLRARIHKHHV